MCGRTALNLQPDVIQKACSYKDPKSGKKKYKKPEWKEHPQTTNENKSHGYEFYPSSNIAPTKFSPILYKPKDSEELVVQPMFWTLIPPWHKGEPQSSGWRTINCRIEGLIDGTSKLFMIPFNKKRMCAVVCQGFYEWKVEKNKKEPKQPYFIYMSQDHKFSPNDLWKEKTWESGSWTATKGWTGPKILMMAGLYNVWKSPNGELIYNYTIITMDTPKKYAHLHHRIPAILETPEQLHAWLNPSPEASNKEILSILKPPKLLDYYPVSTNVNNSRYGGEDCMKPLNRQEKLDQIFKEAKGSKRTFGQKPKAELDDNSSGDEEEKEGKLETKKPKVEET